MRAQLRVYGHLCDLAGQYTENCQLLGTNPANLLQLGLHYSGQRAFTSLRVEMSVLSGTAQGLFSLVLSFSRSEVSCNQSKSVFSLCIGSESPLYLGTDTW